MLECVYVKCWHEKQNNLHSHSSNLIASSIEIDRYRTVALILLKMSWLFTQNKSQCNSLASCMILSRPSSSTSSFNRADKPNFIIIINFGIAVCLMHVNSTIRRWRGENGDCALYPNAHFVKLVETSFSVFEQTSRNFQFQSHENNSQPTTRTTTAPTPSKSKCMLALWVLFG